MLCYMNTNDVKKMEVLMPTKRGGATYYTVSELADRLNVHRNSVIYWIKSGKIKAERFGLADRSPYQIEEHEADRVISELSSL